MVKQKVRLEFIDLAKGFCIFLVVWMHCCGHLHLKSPLDVALSSFRMPLYFFLSGLFFKTYDGIIGFLKRKINKLLIPFLFFFLTCSVFLPNILYELGYEVRNTQNIGWLNSLFVIFSGNQRIFSNGPIWFLICLFEVNLFFYCIFLFAKKTKYEMFFLLVLSIGVSLIGYHLGKNELKLPLYIDSAMSALFFFVCGYLTNKKTPFLLPNKMDKYLLLYVVLCACYVLVFAEEEQFLSNRFGNLLPFYSCGIIGTLMVLFLSKKIKQLPIVSYCGRYSIIVLCTHQMIIQVVLLVVRKMFSDQWICVSITFILTIMVEMIVIPACRKYLPYVTAQKDVIKID